MKVLLVIADTKKKQALVDALAGIAEQEIFEASERAEIEAQLKQYVFDYVFVARAALPLFFSVLEDFKNIKHLPVIALHSFYDEKLVENALNAGAHECICFENLNEITLRMALVKAKNLCAYKEVNALASEAMRQSCKMEAVGRLTSGVAHDFNNLLTVVMGNIHLLQRRLERLMSESEYAEVFSKVEAIKTVSDKGAELVRRLMIFTRQTELSKEVVEVNSCIHETFELLKRTLGEAIEIAMNLSAERWSAYLDPIEFENMLINFAVNARDAMPDGGRLVIETENVYLDDQYTIRHPNMAVGHYVMIVISDTGHGMSPEVMKNIFEPFYTTKPAGEGTGLGMSMAYGFIQQCGGFLHVYSEVGSGTVFRIYLPRQQACEDALATYQPATKLVDNKTVLVVEDDAVISEIACGMLTDLGYEVMFAQNADNACKVLETEASKIHLVFTDIHMPGNLNGVDLARIVRKKYKNIPVLLSSGFSESAIPEYILEAGEQIISKPFRREILELKINSVMCGAAYGQC